MWSDDRWRLRQEEDRVYRVRPARLAWDHQCFCYGMRGRPHLVSVEPLSVSLLNFCFIFLRKRHFSLWGKLSFFCKTFPGLSNTIAPFIPFEFFNSVKLHSIWLVEFYMAPDEFRDVPRNLDPLLSSTPAVGSKRSFQSEVVQHQMLLQWHRQRETLWPLQSRYDPKI